MISIRRATIKDYDEMLRMAVDFTAEHPAGDPVDHNQFAQYFEASLPGHPMLMLVATQHGKPCGMLFGLVYPLFFNPARTICQELMIWVDPASRASTAASDLVAAWEAWGADMGATRFLLTSPVHDRIEAVERLYRAWGYTPLERTYCKEIEQCQ